MYLHCPECRLTVYRSVDAAADATCPRCGAEAIWCSPPFTRTDELRLDPARERERASRLATR